MTSTESRDSHEYIELVFGVASAVGTPDEEVLASLEAQLHLHGYTSVLVKVSDILKDSIGDAWPATVRPDERIKLLMDKGNEVCRETGSAAALAQLVLDEVSSRRPTPTADANGAPGSEEAEASERRRAYIVDSLKRPDEVLLLREVYGDRFILIGMTSPLNARREHLTAAVTPHLGDAAEVEMVVDKLIKRDESEEAETHEYGQDVAGVLPLSDVVISVSGNGDDGHPVRRLFRLLFADPDADLPTDVEYGMQLAAQAATRSPELGLRVGAAMLTGDRDVLACGTNHHPTDSTSPEYDAGMVDVGRMLRDALQRMAKDHLLDTEVAKSFLTNPDAYVTELLTGTLKKSELRAITEYQRPVHAEMDALVSVLRQQGSTVGATLYVTAYPCHNCAKHLIAADVSEVVYLEPYAKSRAASMYKEHVDRFVPFSGVAPRRYASWFIEARRSDRKHKVTGAALTWSNEDRKKAVPFVTGGVTLASVRRREDLARGTQPPDEVPADPTGSLMTEPDV